MLVSSAIVLGIIGDWLRLPRVTSYLIAGVLLGPSLFGFVTGPALHNLEPIADIAMALVLFNLGARFSINYLCKIRERIALLAIGDLLATFLFVTVGLLLFGQSLAMSLMLGCLAMATAPATTILVLRELRSDGPVTESAQALVAVNNLACVLVFELLLFGFLLFDGSQSIDLGEQASRFAWTFLGSVLIGAAFGLIVSFMTGFLSTIQWMAVMLAASTAVLGICEIYPVSYMLTFIVMGFVFANVAPDSFLDLAESERVTKLLSIAFFAIHGADLQASKFMQLGTVGIAYIILRCLGKYVGIRMGASRGPLSKNSNPSKNSNDSKNPSNVRNWLGTAMLSQAGAAIALSAVAVSRNEAAFEPVQTIILGSVLFFEILGPILIRTSVVQSSEVPKAHVNRHPSGSILEQVRMMLAKFRKSIGVNTLMRDEFEGLTVSTLSRPIVEGIPQGATLDAIISYVEDSPDNTFAVTDNNNAVVGVIRYPILSECLFDPSISELALAEDIATPPSRLFHPDEPAISLYHYFLECTDDIAPVVSRDYGSMTGVVRRSDVRALLISSRRKGGDH